MQDRKRIMLLPGDGIGPEVMAQGVKLLHAMEEPLGISFEYEEHAVGGQGLKDFGVPLREETLQRCKAADAVLLGAVGLPEFDQHPAHLRPERALLDLRSGLGVFCNLRPIHLYKSLLDASSLKSEVIRDIDLLVVRELTGGLYFGKPAGVKDAKGERNAVNTMKYSEGEIKRIARKAFEFARKRKRKVTSVDKANVLAVSQLWRSVVDEEAKSFSDVRLEHMLVDNCAMQLILNPRQFDVILTENMFGDILSDEASMLTGSIGMLPSASIGAGTALYEPVHGSAPDLAGKNVANPIAMMSSVAMMLKYSFDRPLAAMAIEEAISTVLARGFHSADLKLKNGTLLGTDALGDAIVKETVHCFYTTDMTV
ncbi:MAG: 3-isopropylmalate dehydrogenase [bacterium]